MDGNTETAAGRGWQGQRQRGGGRRPVTMARRPRFLGMPSRIKARGQVTATRCGEKMISGQAKTRRGRDKKD
jgi:hypothetical protein